MADAPATSTIYVDADACPVKAEVYRVAERHGCRVVVVANDFISVPANPLFERVIVGDGLDAADDWIAARAGPGDIVVTADVPLADRSVKAGALAITPRGQVHTADTIGLALATRNLMTDLRAAGETTSGPRPFSKRDRSAFLSSLHESLERLSRSR